VQEIAGAGAKIEHTFAPAPIELEGLDAPEVDSDPPIQLKIFAPAAARIIDRVTIVDRLELNRVDARDDLFGIEAKHEPASQGDATEMPAGATKEARVADFSELVGEAHWNERLYP